MPVEGMLLLADGICLGKIQSPYCDADAALSFLVRKPPAPLPLVSHRFLRCLI